MGMNDAQEMLEAAQEECIRLERENAELLRRAERAETLNQNVQHEFRQTGAVKAERDSALAVIEQVRELAGGIIEQSHCGYLGKDILNIVGEKEAT